MNGAIKEYLLSVAASAMLLSLIQTILPKDSVRRVAVFIGGLLLVLAVVSPIVDLDYDSLAQSITDFRAEATEIETYAASSDRELMAEIIKEQCRTYIWDKANELGANLEVEVTLSKDGDYPYPVSVILIGKLTSEQRSQLTEYISRNMDIPPQRQEWRSH